MRKKRDQKKKISGSVEDEVTTDKVQVLCLQFFFTVDK